MEWGAVQSMKRPNYVFTQLLLITLDTCRRRTSETITNIRWMPLMCFRNINSLIPTTILYNGHYLLSPCLRWRERGPERWSNQPKITQPEVGWWTHILRLQGSCIHIGNLKITHRECVELMTAFRSPATSWMETCECGSVATEGVEQLVAISKCLELSVKMYFDFFF